MAKYDVFGIGSALMDILVEVDETHLLEFDLKKGEMTLIDENKSIEILDKIRHLKPKLAPGGSAANVLAGIANMGGKVVFCGKVGKDENGLIYEQKMIDGNVSSNISKSGKITGHAITFITPDFERTFATHLGAAIMLQKEDVFEEELKASKFLHIEGYQLEGALKETAIHAMEIAKKNEVKISIDLADASLIGRNLEELKQIVKRYAYIVFANEKEAKAFTGKEPEEAADGISKLAKIAVVKTGEKGSLIKSGEKLININAFSAKAVDTTGAGDMYAAGFLFGLCYGKSLKQCGKIGSYAAARIVEQLGGRLDYSIKEEIEKRL